MVVTSFLYYFGYLPAEDTPMLFFLLGAGIAYIIGYALQDGFSLLPFVSTVPLYKLNCYSRFLYRRFAGETWKDIDNSIDFEKRKENISDEKQLAELERIITLKQVGTTGGPCALVSSVFIWLKWYKSCDGFDLGLFLAALGLGVLLIHLGWIKLAQQSQYLNRHP